MCNVGCRPTIGEGNARTIETNIFGFEEDIYGLDIEVTFLKKIRDEVKFASLEDLKMQLTKDRNSCQTVIPNYVNDNVIPSVVEGSKY
jgi:riboflavin kinase/FMN adenylyltransferase